MPKALPAFPTSKVREPGVLGSTDTEYAEDSPGYVDLWPASCGVRLEAAIWRRSILSGASSELCRYRGSDGHHRYNNGDS